MIKLQNTQTGQMPFYQSTTMLQKKITLEKGKTYLIPKGSILNGEIVLPSEGDIRIYIEGIWQIVNNDLQLRQELLFIF